MSPPPPLCPYFVRIAVPCGGGARNPAEFLDSSIYPAKYTGRLSSCRKRLRSISRPRLAHHVLVIEFRCFPRTCLSLHRPVDQRRADRRPRPEAPLPANAPRPFPPPPARPCANPARTTHPLLCPSGQHPPRTLSSHCRGPARRRVLCPCRPNCVLRDLRGPRKPRNHVATRKAGTMPPKVLATSGRKAAPRR